MIEKLKKQSGKLTGKSLLAVLATLFLTSSCTNFEWTPTVWVGDYQQEGITSENGDTLRCSNPEVNEYTCFHYTDIQDLNRQINDLKITKKQKEDLKRFINKTSARRVEE